MMKSPHSLLLTVRACRSLSVCLTLINPIMPRPCARVYPNGEFSLWWETERLDISDAPEPDPLGLSTLPNSHKDMLGLPRSAPRKRQGLTGISSYGAKMVRNGCYLLQNTYGKQCLSFLTCTLPPLPNGKVLSPPQWSEIVRQLVQSVRRLLRSRGLPGTIVGVTEIQMQRYEREGGMPLHLHLVFQGRTRWQKGWAISTLETDIIWLRACLNAEPAYQGADFSSSCKIHKVEKTAEGYLGKYLSKGRGAIAAILEGDPAAAEYLPSAWWICSTQLKRAIESRTRYGEGVARGLMRNAKDSSCWFDYWRDCWVPLGDNPKAIHYAIGRLSASGRHRMGMYGCGRNKIVAREEDPAFD